MPVGFGGEEPRISGQMLQRGDRVLCFTHRLIEEHEAGEEQLIHWVNRVEHTEKGVRAVVRSLPHARKQQRGGGTTDDTPLS
ncbi:hypothetical protein [Streptomyces sp. TRM70350]|uniref:hypothetical protein n=1 Tax=Streptomyces sp. TRM70350 TaxID=2856165 RepID=UPI0027E04101|nr:hypothetical protein [Streptomyces sp. TRM70350]